MSEFSVEQVRLMRSEITDDEFLAFVNKNPGCTWHLDRPIILSREGMSLAEATFVSEEGDLFKVSRGGGILVRRP